MTDTQQKKKKKQNQYLNFSPTEDNFLRITFQRSLPPHDSIYLSFFFLLIIKNLFSIGSAKSQFCIISTMNLVAINGNVLSHVIKWLNIFHQLNFVKVIHSSRGCTLNITKFTMFIILHTYIQMHVHT